MNRYKEYLKSINAELDDKKEKQFRQYYELLVERNKVMNLTGITEYDEVVEKHFIDSALVSAFHVMKGSLIDVGTGAGLPGIPLKILFPELKVVLLDSLNKRINFLEEVIEKLELKDITAIHGRAEDYAKKEEYREGFDYCVSRAVANLSTLSEYCLPFIQVGGSFISYKSGEVDLEIEESKRAIEILGGKVERINKIELPNKKGSRSFIQIKKISNTDKKYPRKSGLPTKKPL